MTKVAMRLAVPTTSFSVKVPAPYVPSIIAKNLANVLLSSSAENFFASAIVPLSISHPIKKTLLFSFMLKRICFRVLYIRAAELIFFFVSQ